MHIMVLGLRGFPNIEGGVEKHAEQLYPILVQLGCDVDVIVRSPYVPKGKKMWRGVKLCRLWAPKFKGIEALVHSVIGVFYAAIIRPDVLHIHAIGPAIVTPIGRLLGLKVVVTHHGPDYDREKWGYLGRKILQMGEKWGMRFATQRIVISDVIRKLVLEKHQLDSTIIPNGVILPSIPETHEVLDRYSLTAESYVLLVSRFVPEKRHIDLIEAFSCSSLEGWKLVLVGEVGNQDKYCSKVLALAKKNPDIVITGFLSGKSLQEIYAHAGIFVLPSSHEGLPIALLEALSYGLPVLASDIPANKEVNLPGENYFPLGDIHKLAEGLRRFASESNSQDSRDHWRALVSKHYNWQHVAQRTLEIYKS